MTLETKSRLGCLEQMFRSLLRVDAVASQAAHITFTMARTFEVGVPALVAGQAPAIDFLGCGLRRIENLRHVPATINVRLAGPVATLAGRATLAVHLCHLGVRIRRESLCHLFMAGCACFGSHKL